MPCLAKSGYGVLLLLTTLLLGAFSVPADAQQESPPLSGARIRVRPDDSGNSWQHGTLLRAKPDSLWYLSAQERDTLVIERSRVSRIQVFDGRTSHMEHGALIGLGAGAAIGIGYGLSNKGEGSSPSYSIGALFLSVGFFGASGLLVGALFGALVREDKWVDAPRLGMAIQGSNASVRLSIEIGPAPQGGSR